MPEFIISALVAWVGLLVVCLWFTANRSGTTGAVSFIGASLLLILLFSAASWFVLKSDEAASYGAIVGAIVVGRFWYEALHRGGVHRAWREIRAGRLLLFFVPWFLFLIALVRFLEARPLVGTFGMVVTLVKLPVFAVLMLLGPILLFGPLLGWLDEYGQKGGPRR